MDITVNQLIEFLSTLPGEAIVEFVFSNPATEQSHKGVFWTVADPIAPGQPCELTIVSVA